jgi:hypothetical protein
VFENRALRRIFEPKRNEVKGTLHDLYFSLNIIRIIKSMSMR